MCTRYIVLGLWWLNEQAREIWNSELDVKIKVFTQGYKNVYPLLLTPCCTESSKIYDRWIFDGSFTEFVIGKTTYYEKNERTLLVLEFLDGLWSATLVGINGFLALERFRL